MRILIGLVVLALAVPASAGLVNGGFEDTTLTGWTCVNVMSDPSTHVPSPANLEGDHRAGDSNCDSRTGGGSQTAWCLPPPDAPDCVLTGGLAGGGPAENYFVILSGACGTQQVTWDGGIFNWSMFELVLPDCCESEVTVEFGMTGNGAWGAAGYHVDAFVLECIPEPGTGLSLLLLAGLPLLRRRR